MNESNVRVIENQWIEMPDGCRIAAKIWVPDIAFVKPVPAVFEYIPYRKRDIKAVRDSKIHGYFAGNGYACIRADLRGSGDSGGILTDEYLQQELDDGIEILRWIASQPWCDGNIGMIGISWGGFNGLQIAALNPPELKAVISVCSSDDRYADDIHYMGGCLLTDNLSWASTMFAYNSCPPDPQVVGEKWEKMWLDRLDKSGLWLKNWLEHQRKDSFWKHASISENYAAVKAPVFLVSGWADGYSNSVFRMLENLSCPRKGLVGPWGHKYPHMGGPGPEIDFLGECIRWWDYWLKGKQTGVMSDPMLRVWMQHTVSPLSDKRPGRWAAEKMWPSPNIREKELIITQHGLKEHRNKNRYTKKIDVISPLSVGLFGGKWCSYSERTDLPWDQREEDGGAVIFETEPLKGRLDILGRPVVRLTFSSDKPWAMIALRLCDIGRDARATRVTFGVLNLTHFKSDEEPVPLEPGKPYTVDVPMNYISQSFPKHHKIRLSVSTSYWPLVWPSPEPARLTLHTEESKMILPVRPENPDDAELKKFDRPKEAEGIKKTLLSPSQREWSVTHNLADNSVKVRVVNNDEEFCIDEIDLTVKRDVSEVFTYYGNNYDTVRGEVTGRRRFKRNDWEVLTVTRTVLASNRTHFRINATLDAYKGDARVFSKSWDENIPRDHV